MGQQLKTTYIIIDDSSNSGNKFISDDGSNCSQIEFAAEFESLEEANSFANKLSDNLGWWTVVKKSDHE